MNTPKNYSGDDFKASSERSEVNDIAGTEKSSDLLLPLEAGAPSPLGAHFDGEGVNFAIFSAHAEKIELCLFEDQGHEKSLPLPMRSGDLWHGYLRGARPGLRYGFRVHGPWRPSEGHRFNPAKLLLDPCARMVVGGSGALSSLLDGRDKPNRCDNADIALKSVVVHEDYDWGEDKRLHTPWGKTVIYEAHVRGLTMRHPAIPTDLRGTYAALGHPVMLDYLKRLGITALELLPVCHFASESHLKDLSLSNYWGYNPIALWCLEPTYARNQDPLSARKEFCDAVKNLHSAGIEVIIDIVLNHSAEGGAGGPTLNLRGIDNRSYYWLQDNGDYQNWTGCGNTLNLSHPAVVDFVVNCLKYWVESFHVDGFRFDLATVMGRTPHFRQDAPLFNAIKNDPILSSVKLIAEPWDIGPNGYQVGHYPAFFSEWNDHFRDTIRRFWIKSRQYVNEHSSNEIPLGNFATCFAASPDLFKKRNYLPSRSINFVTAHDGFTLWDCVSFNHKHNEANGEANCDGIQDNHSCNHGFEGIDASPEIIKERTKTIHAVLTSLLLSQGVPMLLAGDEQGHTQQGNNNTYCQDNELAWLDWTSANQDLIRFTAALIHLRQKIPALTEDRWWEEGDREVRWLNREAQPLNDDEWQQGPLCLQILLSEHWLFVLNATEKVCSIKLPEGKWRSIPLFSGFDESKAVWSGDAYSVCVFQKNEQGIHHD